MNFPLLLRNMTTVRTLRLRYFATLPKSPNPLQNPVHSCSIATVDFSPNYRKLSLISSIFCRGISISAHFDAESISSNSIEDENRKKTMKPLHLIFEEAVGLSEKLERSSDSENESETIELKKNLRKLEEQVRSLKERNRESVGSIKNLKKKNMTAGNDYGISKVNSNNSRSLYALFAANNNSEKTLNTDRFRKEEDQRVYKELSPDMVLFVTYLYHQGYFINANFFPRNTFDVSCFENSYGRDFIKYAAEKFGKANQEIAKGISISAHFDAESISSNSIEDENRKKTMKPLHLIFEEAVGLSEKLERSSDSENESETIELKKNLRKLEEQVRSLKERNRESVGSIKNLKKKNMTAGNDYGISKVNSNNSRSLYALFAANNNSEKTLNTDRFRKEEDQRVYKELSPDMVLFVTYLYHQGYFINANFFPRNTFDVSCFENSYGRDFIKYAAEKFGKANQEIAKWLSASDLQKVARIGCPSFGRKNVFSAKRLRNFLGIQEETVCSQCPLRTSCKFVNQSVWKGDTKNLNLAVVMRVITLYALESVPSALVVPEEVKDSVNRLLKEVLSLSQTLA